YIHAIDGRLRVKVPEVKRSPAYARQLESWFRSFEGIQEVRANPITGNVLFLHDPEQLPAREILGALVAAGYMGMGIDAGRAPARPEELGELAATIAEWVCWGLSRAGCNFRPGAGWLGGRFEAATRVLVKLCCGRVRS